MPYADPNTKASYMREYLPEYFANLPPETKALYRRRKILKYAQTHGQLPTKRSIEKYNFSKQELLPIMRTIIA